MSMGSFGFALAVMVSAVLVGSVAGASNTNLVSSACNTQKIPIENYFFNNLGALLVDLEKNTAFSG
jgi:hypothetical protein